MVEWQGSEQVLNSHQCHRAGQCGTAAERRYQTSGHGSWPFLKSHLAGDPEINT